MEKSFIKPCKKVETVNTKNEKNGWLLEIVSDKDNWTENIKGQCYLTVVAPNNYKGFHIHAATLYHFVCVKGKIKSIIYAAKENKREITMGEGDFKAIKVFPGEAHCLLNEHSEPAYILGFRYPAWTKENPDQLTVAPEDIDKEESWIKIRRFNQLARGKRQKDT